MDKNDVHKKKWRLSRERVYGIIPGIIWYLDKMSDVEEIKKRLSQKKKSIFSKKDAGSTYRLVLIFVVSGKQHFLIGKLT